MKKFYSKLILILLISLQSLFNYGYSQTHHGDVFLQSQAEVDSFGAMGYSHIAGKLYIGDTNFFSSNTISNITNITALENLQRVDSTLMIFGNYSLLSLEGLDSLTYVGKSLELIFNFGVQSLEPLSELDTINKRLLLNYTNSLNNLEGLENLQYVKNIELVGNLNLSSLNGIDNITSLRHLFIWKNDNLSSLSGLENLTHVEKFISIYENSGITTLNGLDNLESVNVLTIKNNEELTDYCILSTQYNNGYLSQFDPNNFNVEDNGYDPEFQDIINHDCILGVSTVNPTEIVTSIAPNPTTGIVTFNFNETNTKQIRVINALGQIVDQRNNISTSDYMLNIKGSKGIYTVEIQDEKSTQKLKVIKF